MTRNRIGALVAIAFGAATVVSTASAQEIISDPQQLAACYCLEHTIGQRGSEMTIRRQVFDQRTSELAMLEQRIQRERPMVIETDPVQVGRFRDLLERRDALAQAIDGPAIADLQSIIARYNQAVEEHRIRCLGRYYNDMVMNQVRATTQCPAY